LGPQPRQQLPGRAWLYWWYITQIYGKLGVKSRVHALVRSRELGLLE
jgi:hypothetical protein